MKTLSQRSFKLLTGPLEPLLHLSRERLLSIGIMLFLGHITFGVLWTYVIPQQYENMGLRILASIASVPFFFLSPTQVRDNPVWRWYCVVTIIITTPLFFLWMFMMNPNSAMWMTTISLALVVLYQVLDWRIATASVLILAALMKPLLCLVDPYVPVTHLGSEDWIVMAFAWMLGFATGISSANQHIQQLQSTLRAMGVVAHELRTPLASISLLAESLRSGGDPIRTSAHLSSVVKRMNHQIDSQIINAQLIDLKPGSDEIGARALIQNAIDTYPIKSENDRMSIILEVRNDFLFIGNTRLFTQTLQNLLKNALHALMKSGKSLARGDILIDVSRDGDWGLIRITDRGPGIPGSIQRSIFEPFYSTQGTYSSGLGLAFCKQVVEINQGKIWVESSTPKGTTFAIRVPCRPDHLHPPVTGASA